MVNFNSKLNKKENLFFQESELVDILKLLDFQAYVFFFEALFKSYWSLSFLAKVLSIWIIKGT